jgi:UPF0755 protein
MNIKNYKRIGALFFVGLIVGGLALGWAVKKIHTPQREDQDIVIFSVEKNETVSALAARLENEGIISSATLFQYYLRLKKIDTKIQAGSFSVKQPVTIASVAGALLYDAGQEERQITILPGWNNRDVAEYFDKEGIATKEEVLALLGTPAQDYRTKPFTQLLQTDAVLPTYRPVGAGYEGYLAPDTYRVFASASIEEILEKLIDHRDAQITEQMYVDIKNAGRSVHEVMTIASLLEREVRSKEDRKKVADLFWRRYDENWALQADSTVHFLTGKAGNVFTTKEDRDSLSPWNTYKYPGLPLGPIAHPSLSSIDAAIYPESNSYNYFLTDFEGNVHYATDLAGHNKNVQTHLR